MPWWCLMVQDNMAQEEKEPIRTGNDSREKNSCSVSKWKSGYKRVFAPGMGRNTFVFCFHVWIRNVPGSKGAPASESD